MTNRELRVVKRDGSRVPLDIEKLHKVVFWATEDLSGVSASEVEMKSQIQFYDGMKTTEIQETMIKAAADLISEESPNYQYVGGRLINYLLRKEVYNQFKPIRLYDLIVRNVEAGFYDPLLLDLYTEEQWDAIETFVDHERDFGLTYVAMEQMRGKYLVQNRATGKILETPQVLYILVAASLFARYPAETRMTWVRDYYDAISRHEISLPTPIMAGVRTPIRQYSSCTLIECDDSLVSINATSSAIVDYVSQRAGIGLGAGRIRALGSPVRNGDTTHTGVTPFFKLFQSAVNSCNQGGVRKGSATLYYPIWHYEIEEMLVLKNNKGIEENRVRHMDYGVQFNKLFYERLITGGDITCFSPNDVPEMYDAFFNDYDKFKTLYEKAERNTKLRKKKIKAIDLFTAFANERKDTGRIYLMNVDNANTHSSFLEKVAPVRMSNLCAEITLTTVPMGTVRTENVTIPAAALPRFMLDAFKDEKAVEVKKLWRDDAIFGEGLGQDVDMIDVETTEDLSRIALCTLSASNWGVVKSKHDFERIARLTVRGLDALLDHQEYPVKAARLHTMEYRPIGIGIINFAYFLAKNGVKYSDNSALALVDEYAEAWSYYLIKASVELAKEVGPCKLVANTKYSQGIVPIDTRKRDVDELVPHQERMDWESLRQDLRTYGIRNATLMAVMPAETSAQIANATNGIEPPRALISVKQSKHGVLKQVVPEFRKLRNKYELLWDQKSPEGYLNLCCVLQKYIDQSISVNTSYNPIFYPEEKVPMSEMLKHMLLFYKRGGKTLYYCNTQDGSGELDVNKLAEDVASSPMSADEEACASCTI
jgi:ribonucleoside-diphosphate reductase alpha chain